MSDVHETSGMTPPPPGTLSGNHPRAGIHPWMNFRSEHRASNYVRASIVFHLSCVTIVCLCLLGIYCFFPPLLLSGSPDDRCRCPCDRLRRRRPYPLLSSFQASSAPPLSQIPPTFLYFIYHTRHMLLLRCLPIQLHSLSLLPIVVPFRYPMLPYI